MEIQKDFDSIISKTQGLQAIIVSDKDGVVLIQSTNPAFSLNNIDSSLSTSFAVACDQIGKIGLSKNKSITTFYKYHQIIQFNYNPLIITFIADKNANTGYLLNIGAEFEKPLNAIANSIVNSE
ncbi:Roadblock/LC7 domain-containing protein [Neocallimastix lanati (nom. inval.)]|uniref:Roadblock/LC7 domain-containing protein n=1 Tax=Neocallimastix californiae TaxID=1754190 RepID=A0A1Y2AQD2_9FUNG|nr:Roadblock/LC7 domain-containing protein [Neocallimastix sp. JGI-2020a]ORY24427.1 Roadblock/LC7 domain-containing protein [Neocallimastix californiae]|eukprot:ORY24427.1 Roadblock/LC7 domain-containing protein [Neocallimastix californiae]